MKYLLTDDDWVLTARMVRDDGCPFSLSEILAQAKSGGAEIVVVARSSLVAYGWRSAAGFLVVAHGAMINPLPKLEHGDVVLMPALGTTQWEFDKVNSYRWYP